jgi:hypothetical protein
MPDELWRLARSKRQSCVQSIGRAWTTDLLEKPPRQWDKNVDSEI